MSTAICRLHTALPSLHYHVNGEADFVHTACWSQATTIASIILCMPAPHSRLNHRGLLQLASGARLSMPGAPQTTPPTAPNHPPPPPCLTPLSPQVETQEKRGALPGYLLGEEHGGVGAT